MQSSNCEYERLLTNSSLFKTPFSPVILWFNLKQIAIVRLMACLDSKWRLYYKIHVLEDCKFHMLLKSVGLNEMLDDESSGKSNW